MRFTEDKSDFQEIITSWSLEELLERWWYEEKIKQDDIFEEIITKLNLDSISYKYTKEKNEDLIQELVVCVYESLFNYNPNKGKKKGDNLIPYIHYMLKHKAREYCKEHVYNEGISRRGTDNLTNYIKSLKRLKTVDKDRLSIYGLEKYKEARKYLRDNIYFLKITSSHDSYRDDMSSSIDNYNIDRDTYGLPPEQQYIIDYLEKGYSVKEIATSMGVSFKTVYNRIDKMKEEEW